MQHKNISELRTVLATTALLAVWGSAMAETKEDKFMSNIVRPQPGEEISIEGRLDQGVECPVIHTDDGRLFSVSGGLSRADMPPMGTTVRLRATVLDTSFCMQGVPLSVIEMEE